MSDDPEIPSINDPARQTEEKGDDSFSHRMIVALLILCTLIAFACIAINALAGWASLDARFDTGPANLTDAKDARKAIVTFWLGLTTIAIGWTALWRFFHWRGIVIPGTIAAIGTLASIWVGFAIAGPEQRLEVAAYVCDANTAAVALQGSSIPSGCTPASADLPITIIEPAQDAPGEHQRRPVTTSSSLTFHPATTTSPSPRATSQEPGASRWSAPGTKLTTPHNECG